MLSSYLREFYTFMTFWSCFSRLAHLSRWEPVSSYLRLKFPFQGFWPPTCWELFFAMCWLIEAECWTGLWNWEFQPTLFHTYLKTDTVLFVVPCEMLRKFWRFQLSDLELISESQLLKTIFDISKKPFVFTWCETFSKIPKRNVELLCSTLQGVKSFFVLYDVSLKLITIWCADIFDA